MQKTIYAFLSRPIRSISGLHDDCAVETHLLHEVFADVRVLPVKPCIGKLDLVRERAADGDRLLGFVRHTVEAVLEPQTMPMHGRLHIAIVAHLCGDLRALIHVEGRTRN